MRVSELLWIDWDREETDSCQRGTIGCPVDHDFKSQQELECTTW